jgi:hypothetical protein
MVLERTPIRDDRRCTAITRRTGQRCGSPAIKGGSVCVSHGGRLATTRAAADKRLEALQHPAIAALDGALQADSVHVTRDGDVITTGPDHAVRIRAATSVLDRSGMGPTTKQEIAVDASVRFLGLIQELDARDDEHAPPITTVSQRVDDRGVDQGE